MATNGASTIAAAPPTNAEICHFFFEPAVEPATAIDADAAAASSSAPSTSRRTKKRAGAAETPPVNANGRANRHRCRLCWNIYTQNASTGYTNLMTHLRIKHTDWPEIYRAQRLPPNPLAAAGSVSSATPAPSASVHPTEPPSVTPSAPSSPPPAPQRMVVGRKRGPVYSHFQDLPDAPDSDTADGKKPATKRVRCVHCGVDVPQLSGRLKLHLVVACAEAPAAVKSEYAGQVNASEAAGAPRAAKRQKRASLGPGTTVSTDHVTAKSASNTPVKAVAAAAGRHAREKGPNAHAFEDKLTAAIVSDRVPWSFLDNKQFQEALTLLAYPSGFESGPNAVEFPLTAARASTVVVNRLADDYDRKTASSLGNAKFATLVVDRRQLSSSQAASSTKSERIKLIAVDELRRSFLLLSRVGSAGTSATDAAKFASGVLEAGVRSQPFPDSAKLFLCSDATDGNFSHLRRLFNELNQQPAPVVDDGAAQCNANSFALIGSCMAQQSALLLKEVIHETNASSTIADAVAIATALRALPEFARVPSVTDWSSVAQMVHRVAGHENRVRDAFGDKKSAQTVKSDAELTALAAVVRDDSFWSALKAIDALLTPLNACAAMSELPFTTSGQYLSLWLWAFALTMESPLLQDNAAKTRFAERFFRRMQMYVEDHQIVSLVLDPRVRGAGLSSSGLRRARGVAVRVASSLIPTLDETSFVRSYNDYVKKQGDFGDDGLWNAANTSDPLQFWSDFDGDALHGQLARVALAVCAFVPHARSVQSYWSASVADDDDSDDGPESESHETLDKIRFALEDTKERRVGDMIARYGALVGIQPINAGASDLGAASDGATVRSISAPATTPDLDQVLSSLVDYLDQDVAAAGGNAEASASGSVTRVDASWLDVTAAGAAQVQSAVVAFFDSVGSSAARFSMELVV